jgi:hypothetical protein
MEDNFKVGDWIVFKGYSKYYDDKVLQIHRITKHTDTSFLYINADNSDNGESHKARHATYQEMLNKGIVSSLYEIY